MLPLTKNEAEMERNVIASLDKVDINKIRRYYLFFYQTLWLFMVYKLDLQIGRHGLWMHTGVA